MDDFIKKHKSYLNNQYKDFLEVLEELSEISPKLAEAYKCRVSNTCPQHPYKLMKRLLCKIMRDQKQGFISP